MPPVHLTLSEREVISQMRYSGASLSAIGKALGKGMVELIGTGSKPARCASRPCAGRSLT